MSAKLYREFFLESQPGQQFMTDIQAMISRAHEAGEKDLPNARDYAGRALGIRDVISHIHSLTAQLPQDKEADKS